jgi:hypothetical protein
MSHGPRRPLGHGESPWHDNVQVHGERNAPPRGH